MSQIHCENVNELFDIVGLEALDGAVKSCIPTSSVLKQELHLQLLQKEIQNMKEKDKSEANEKFQKSLKQSKLRLEIKKMTLWRHLPMRTYRFNRHLKRVDGNSCQSP